MSKSDLSPARKQLLHLMQKMSFCRIQRLHVKNKEPVFDPAPTVVQDLKIGGNNDSRVEIHLRDYPLKQAHVELFHHFDEINNGVIDELDVNKHGIDKDQGRSHLSWNG